MKNTIGLLFILLVLACNEPVPLKTDLYVYLDYTEGQQYDFDKEEVEKYLSLMEAKSEHSRNAGSIKIFPLYNLSSSKSVTVKLKEGKSKFEGNRYLRQKELKEFTTKVLDKIGKMNETYGGDELEASHIFNPLNNGFKKLLKSNADRKVVLIYSDMLENSKVANFHSNSANEKTLLANFEEVGGVDDLSEVELYIVYPIDQKNDAKIRKRLSVWEQYFVQHGIDSELFHADTGIDL